MVKEGFGLWDAMVGCQGMLGSVYFHSASQAGWDCAVVDHAPEADGILGRFAVQPVAF